MSMQLRRALGEATAQQIHHAIRLALEELLPLRQRVAEVELLIARAYDTVDPTGYWVPWPPMPAPHRPPTLHKAIEMVLAQNRNDWMYTGHITRAIARRGLYRRRDGLPPTVND